MKNRVLASVLLSSMLLSSVGLFARERIVRRKPITKNKKSYTVSVTANKPAIITATVSVVAATVLGYLYLAHPGVFSTSWEKLGNGFGEVKGFSTEQIEKVFAKAKALFKKPPVVETTPAAETTPPVAEDIKVVPEGVASPK